MQNSKVTPKKHLGQHFLKDLQIAERIVKQLTQHQHYTYLLEIGPGTGILTNFLIQASTFEFYAMDLDRESIDYLKHQYPEATDRIIEGNFLHTNPRALFGENMFGIIGNFPYNISSQIFFKILDHYQQIPEIVCMLQKEVAERIASPPGNKSYGILSVFLQAYYDIVYLFTVEPEVFSPPPKVRSGVIRLTRNAQINLACNEKNFRQVVKQGFNNRRKTLRNALKPLQLSEALRQEKIFSKRAEELSVEDFVELTNKISRDGGFD